MSFTLPPRSSVFVEVLCDEMPEGAAAAADNLSLLFMQGVCIARGVVHVQNGSTHMLATNFSREHRHLFCGTGVPYIVKITQVAHCFMLREITMVTHGEN